MGYHLAGFDVVGVDIKPQPRYPFPFTQADAMDLDWQGYDAIHASPPCQPFTRAGHLMRAQGRTTKEPDLLVPVRERLLELDTPWIIENVVGAPLLSPLTLCGSTFGLKVRRHRLFESSHLLLGNGPCRHKEQGKPVGIYGSMGDTAQGLDTQTGRWVVGGVTAKTLAEGQEAMGIDWMRWNDLKNAVPPAYTQHLGSQILTVLRGRMEGQPRALEDT
jgi:hypothetical protein